MGGLLQLGDSQRRGQMTLPKQTWEEGEEPGGRKWGGAAQLGSPCAAGLVVDVVPSDDVGSPCGHGRANGEGEALVECLSEQGQHLVALGAVREVGHPCGTRIPNSGVRVFSLRGGGGRGGRQQCLKGLDPGGGSFPAD